MKILVVGGAGYIGSHVTLEAINHGYEVTVFDDLSSGLKDNINASAAFFQGSTLSDTDLSRVMKNCHFDAVIHLAANKAAGESMDNPSEYAKNNIIGGINLIRACEEYGINKFIFSSSAAVYGSPKYNPIDELHPLAPSNFYGYTKLAIENNLQWFSRLKGLRYAALRYFNAAGYDINQRIIGKEINPQNLIPIVMEVASGTRKKLSVFGNDYSTKDGTGIRDYIHVSDLACGHIMALNYLIKHEKDLTVNLGTGDGHSVLDIISMARKVSNKKIEYEFTGRRDGDPGKVIAAGDNAKKLINWDPKYSELHTIISSTWNIYNQ
ncbi:MAG: UDP-glucose 4-epimerase GalE [Candidatus Marinimicrobia bacterium]|nr:UDP-glucose 4-epimerase GalE [Candidatus Neomarinimicrobiota bacterium]